MSLRRVLGRYVRAPRREGCELCGAPFGQAHRHVLELATHTPKCACLACALSFTGGEKLRTIPERTERVTIDEAMWSALGIPVGVAFLVRRTGAAGWIASYPSPAGVVESEVNDPRIDGVEDDVEAILVHRARGAARIDAWIAPIDRCFRLVAAVRARPAAEAEDAIARLLAEMP
jgi:hypothetical protein